MSSCRFTHPRPAPARRRSRTRLLPLCVGALTLAACGGGGEDTVTAAAADGRATALNTTACGSRANNTLDKLLDCVGLAGVRQHQAALQAIADAHGGNRAAGTSGYDASVAYVRDRMLAAGYQVSLHAFPFDFQPPAVLQQLAPLTALHPASVFVGSGTGSVTAAVTPVDLQLALPRANTSGCEAADFAGFPAGTIALLQRGGCTFAIKVLNAQNAGAVAVVIFNQGDTPQREALLENVTLAPTQATVPVVGASFQAGVTLAQPASQARVVVEAVRTITQYNVIAESPTGSADNVVMVGAHLDSVEEGPGINDNGSGTAALLEVAQHLAKAPLRNKVRFAWWGAEEAGLVGSTAYVDGLSEAERARIALYLNFDMVGSPNHVFFIYDGDDSDNVGAGPGPDGSAQIEKTFERYFTARGIPFKGTDFTGRSDYGPFIAVGIPSGGLFTGAEGVKTAAEAAIWGGTAGEAYDPCYHQACDTFANNSDRALEVNTDAIAFATLTYAMSTEDVNAVRGKGNFRTLKVPFPRNER